jgi:integron integrase
VAAFGNYLRSKGVAAQVADAACHWIEQFRAFRARPATVRCLPESIEQFQAHLRSSQCASAPTIAEAVQAIHRFLGWWRQFKTSGRGGVPQMRPCRPGTATPERDPSLPLDEPIGLLGRVRREIRVRHYSYRTKQTYLHWTERYLRFLAGQDVVACATTGFRRFLEHLAVERQVSAATQNQAFNALLFLYREVLKVDLGTIEGITRARRSRRLPVVLTRPELAQVFAELSGIYLLMAKLMFGTGMRLMECCRLRVKDVDFGRGLILVRDAKGDKDRVVPLPQTLVEPLRGQLAEVRKRHERELLLGRGQVSLPYALARKYRNLDRHWGWQYVFAAPGLCADPRSGRILQHHLHEDSVQRAIRLAARKAGLAKPVHTQLLEAQLCNRPPGVRRGHPHRSGSDGPQGRFDDHDLHACAQPRRSALPQPVGPGVGHNALNQHQGGRGWGQGWRKATVHVDNEIAPPPCRATAQGAMANRSSSLVSTSTDGGKNDEFVAFERAAVRRSKVSSTMGVKS